MIDYFIGSIERDLKMQEKDIYKQSAHFKRLCCDCLKSGKGLHWSCGSQGHTIIGVPHKLRFPSYKAKKSKWKKFLHDVGFGGVGGNIRDIDARVTFICSVNAKT